MMLGIAHASSKSFFFPYTYAEESFEHAFET